MVNCRGWLVNILGERSLGYRHWRLGLVRVDNFRGGGDWWLALYRVGR
jgi:hypothetical protein